MLLLLLAALAPAFAADVAAEDVEKTLGFKGWVELDAAGVVTRFDLETPPGLPAALHEPVRAHVRSVSFHAATHEGSPTTSRSWLEGSMRLLPEGPSYRVEFQPLSLGPRLLNAVLPRLGKPRRTPDRFIVTVRVDTDGRAQDMSVQWLTPQSRRLEAKVRDMVADWRFEPEQRDGVPVATTVNTPVLAYMAEAGIPADDWPTVPVPAGRAYAPGQDGLDATVEVVATRVIVIR